MTDTTNPDLIGTNNSINKNKVRVRIAPSPTGIPHIGTTRTALYNYLFAKKNNGRFILRIEDTDRERLVEGAEEKLHEIFEWLGFTFDEKYKQSERLEIYKEYSGKLIKNNVAYEDHGAIRFRMPKDGITSWIDAVGNKNISFQNKAQEDFVLLKSDGYPTYNFANVIDDHLMQISHVIRGQEFISSTPKHIQLYKAFGWEHPVFVHLPLVLGNDHQKLSKRHGAKSALDYRDEGYLPQAINNYMALLGWNPGGDREIMSLSEMIDLFDIKDINTASPVFDIKKLEWMNGVYIRQATLDELNEKLKIKNEKFRIYDTEKFKKIIALAQSRMTTLNEFESLTGHFFEEPKINKNEFEPKLIESLIESLSQVSSWESASIFKALKSVMTTFAIKMLTLYTIFTGSDRGLPLPESLEILGKEKVLSRLEAI